MTCTNPLTSTHFRDVVLPALVSVRNNSAQPALAMFCIHDGARLLTSKSGKFDIAFAHEIDATVGVVLMDPDTARNAAAMSAASGGISLCAEPFGKFLDDQIDIARRLIATLPKCGCDAEPEPETVAAIHAAITKH